MAHGPAAGPGTPSPAHENMLPSPQAVAGAALDCFAALPRTGKPQAHEHTVLAAIVLSTPTPHCPPTLCVAALATGTKCLGASARDPGGAALNDCHAEVLARRAFLLFLHAHARDLGSQGAVDPLCRDEEGGGGCGAPRLRLRPGVGVHLYVSQPPCGDACVHDADGREAAHGSAGGTLGEARSQENAASASDDREVLGKTGCTLNDKHKQDDPSPTRTLPRTGAKLLGLESQEQALGAAPATIPEPHTRAQASGHLRRKPGRGEGTLSMSCSDKLARWRLLGLQGGLWSRLLAAPLALDSVTARWRA
ncbi:hypothetical protein ACKKBF_B11180 [Auxenochlorella protothecoides x Auxenochlorella symbiontica]